MSLFFLLGIVKMVLGWRCGADAAAGRWVQTDMGNDGARNLGIEKAEITLEESVGGLVAVVCSFALFWAPGGVGSQWHFLQGNSLQKGQLFRSHSGEVRIALLMLVV